MSRRRQRAFQAAISRLTFATKNSSQTLIEKESPGKALREWATLLLLIATTVGVYWQVHEMIKVYLPIQEQADATRESFASVQRAFVTAKQLGSDDRTLPTNQNFLRDPRE